MLTENATIFIYAHLPVSNVETKMELVDGA